MSHRKGGPRTRLGRDLSIEEAVKQFVAALPEDGADNLTREFDLWAATIELRGKDKAQVWGRVLDLLRQHQRQQFERQVEAMRQTALTSICEDCGHTYQQHLTLLGEADEFGNMPPAPCGVDGCACERHTIGTLVHEILRQLDIAVSTGAPEARKAWLLVRKLYRALLFLNEQTIIQTAQRAAAAVPQPEGEGDDPAGPIIDAEFEIEE